jgi:hypothetical protein
MKKLRSREFRESRLIFSGGYVRTEHQQPQNEILMAAKAFYKSEDIYLDKRIVQWLAFGDIFHSRVIALSQGVNRRKKLDEA